MFGYGEIDNKPKYDEHMQPPPEALRSYEKVRAGTSHKPGSEPTGNGKVARSGIAGDISGLQNHVRAIHGENAKYQQKLQNQNDQRIFRLPTFHFGMLKPANSQNHSSNDEYHRGDQCQSR